MEAEKTKEFIKNELFSPTLDLEKQYANYRGILKNAVDGKVVTRFPPEPSGYLHIGHIKAALLNYHYAKMYHGKMILRFDDTNPSKEKMEFVDSIIDDLQTMGIKHDQLSYTSDYFDKILDLGRELIKKGLAYCDNTPVDKMREERFKCIESACRSQTVEQNLEIYEKMMKGEADEYVLRAKIDMSSTNGTLRDPVLARTNKLPHHRTGKKYTLYPTYDFACPVVDSLEGVTHMLRTNEYADRIPQYKWVLQAVGFPDHEIYEFSRLNLQYTVLSKRKLQWFVDTKRVESWSDPRFPTLRGVLRKGIRVETLIEFMLEQGPSKSTNLMEWDKLWAINKRIIDPICPRLMAVTVEKAGQITIANGPNPPEAHTTQLNPVNKEMGERPVWWDREVYIEAQDALEISEGQKITLMKWGNIQITSKKEQPDGSFHFEGQYLEADNDFKTTKKYSWLSKNCNLVQADLVEYDHLITKVKPEEDDKIEDIANANSKFVTRCYVDPLVRTFQSGQFLQFERRGYFKVDKIHQAGEDRVYEFIFTPDGKAKGVASITTEAEKKGDISKKTLAEKVKEKADKEKKTEKAEKAEAKAAEKPVEKKERPVLTEEEKQARREAAQKARGVAPKEAPKTEQPPADK